MKKTIAIVAALFCAATIGFAQQNAELPNDPAVRTGKLDNGLTYYIRHNDKPAQRAEFYLATNVGAIQEAPDQDGLAHFLEHMCFNGTKNFPGKGILNWLESIGASFGGNVNASTGVEQTTYLLTNIPLVRPTVVDTCLLILHDYSHFVNCDPEEIDKERGVIIEEKRTRNTAQWRMMEQSFPYYYGNTKYAGCTIIGSLENLQTFKPESLTTFYHTWYRPDNQAVVVVGDIDVNEVENIIRNTFADIPAPVNPRAKDIISIPVNEEPLIGILTDPENSGSSIEILWKREARPEELNSTVMGRFEDLLRSVIGNVMNERLSDIAAVPDAPFINAGFGFGGLCETAEAMEGSVNFKDGDALNAFAALMVEIEKMKRYGFTDPEVDRAKSNILTWYESKANKAESRKNNEFVRPLINNFFDNVPYMDPKQEFEVVQALLGQINAQIASAYVTQNFEMPDNLSIVYTAPEKDGIAHPAADQLAGIVEAVKTLEIERPAGEEIPEAFLDSKALKGCKAKKSSDHICGAEQFMLKNGVKVILLPTDYEKDRISIDLYQKGGRSLIATEDLASFDDNIWKLYLNNTGIGEFPATIASKMLSGKNVSVNPYIGSYTHGISASSTPKDIETAFQMVYMFSEQPRFDSDEYNQGINQIEAILPNFVQQPGYKFNDAIYKTAFDSPRKQMISRETMDQAGLDKLERVYKSLFTTVNGATLVIVGDFDKDAIRPLVTKYIGSIAKGKATDWKYCGDALRNGEFTNDYTTSMQTPMVSVFQCYSIDAPYTVAKEAAYSALEYIMDMVYVETLREEEGGTYGASTSCAVSHKPSEKRMLQVVFDTNPESADKLRKLAMDGVRGIAENGPTAEQFDKTVKNMLKNIPEKRIRNSYWNNVLETYEKFGYNLDTEYEAAVNALTPEDIKAAAAELINSGNFIEVVQRPE